MTLPDELREALRVMEARYGLDDEGPDEIVIVDRVVYPDGVERVEGRRRIYRDPVDGWQTEELDVAEGAD